MYHEVESPYAFLWHLREGLKPSGEVVVVDSDRPTKRHGIPPGLLTCEFAALGLERTKFTMLAGGEAYFASFRAVAAAAEAGRDPALQRRLEQPHSAQAGAVGAGEDEMVEDRCSRALRRPRPAGAWRGNRHRSGAAFAARMIVGQDDPGAAMHCSIGDDRADREVGAALIALVARHVQAIRVLVDMGDPQAFARRVGIGEAAGKKAPSRLESVDPQREFGTLISHA